MYTQITIVEAELDMAASIKKQKTELSFSVFPCLQLLVQNFKNKPIPNLNQTNYENKKNSNVNGCNSIRAVFMQSFGACPIKCHC